MIRTGCSLLIWFFVLGPLVAALVEQVTGLPWSLVVAVAIAIPLVLATARYLGFYLDWRMRNG